MEQQKRPGPPSEDVTLIVAGKELRGWESVTVTRSMESMPSTFALRLSDPPTSDFGAYPGESCVVKLGRDLVLTGAIDSFSPSISARQHTISVVGRGKCADLVDCCSEWDGGQISNCNARTIAEKLAAPYGIKVFGDDYDDVVIPQMNLDFTATPASVLDMVLRYRALLAFEETDGNLRLANVGSTISPSAIVEGQNVQAASIDFRVDQRYSEYIVMQNSINVFTDTGDTWLMQGRAVDEGVSRHRRKYMVSEASRSGVSAAQKQADWEMKRRVGRSAAIHVTLDSWRDSSGFLWDLNTLVAVNLPTLKLINKLWLITAVTFNRNLSTGTTCDLVIMPPDAFSVPLPTPLPNRDVLEALAGTPLETN
jgi:prophage tail gpP-like protein